jgi:hypothetical protein
MTRSVQVSACDQCAGRRLDTVPDEAELTVHQRHSIGFGTTARTMFSTYPKRSILGLSLFVGQAFLYNAITFGFAQILQNFFDVRPISGPCCSRSSSAPGT